MKNGRWAVAVLGILGAAAAGPAAAQDRGIYLGGSGGFAQYKNSCKRANVPCDDHDTAWRLFGGYQFNRYFSAELGYADLGAATGTGALGTFAVDVRGWDLSALASIPVVGGLSALGRIGMYRARTTVDQVGPGVVTPHAAGTNTGFTYGAGLGYSLWKLGLRAEWQRYENVGNNSIGEDEIDVFSIGALFRF
jgi:OOP family OmpA-OmpF porin